MRYIKILFYTALVSVFMPFGAFAQAWSTNLKAAEKQALEKGQIILVVSDYNASKFIQTDKILSSNEFKRAIKDNNLICVKVDIVWNSKDDKYVAKLTSNKEFMEEFPSAAYDRVLYSPKNKKIEMIYMYSNKSVAENIKSAVNLVEKFCKEHAPEKKVEKK